MTVATTRPRRLVQLDVSPETIAAIDQLAGTETISRTAWLRRLAHSCRQGGRGRMTTKRIGRPVSLTLPATMIRAAARHSYKSATEAKG